MRTHLVFAAGLTLLGACASVPSFSTVEISPVERLSGAMTPERADTLLTRGYHEQAAAAYRATLATHPDDAVAQYGLAEALRRLGKLSESTSGFTTLASIPEYRVRALEGLGRIALAQGDRSAAWEKFAAAVAEDPAAWRSWLAMAQMQDRHQLDEKIAAARD
jgi:Flp pilus assembly protein TadD